MWTWPSDPETIRVGGGGLIGRFDFDLEDDLEAELEDGFEDAFEDDFEDFEDGIVVRSQLVLAEGERWVFVAA